MKALHSVLFCPFTENYNNKGEKKLEMNTTLSYPFAENYNYKEEDKKLENQQLESQEQKFKYGYDENGNIHVELPDVVVIGQGPVQKFESYSKDPDVLNGFDKLLGKLLDENPSLLGRLLGKEFSEKYEKMDVSENLNSILDKHTDLWLTIGGELGLPISEKSFSNLSATQKINYISLYKAVNKRMPYEKNTNLSAEVIMERFRLHKKNIVSDINSAFKRDNIFKGGLENSLRGFGLTEVEVKKMKEYLLLVKDHPELFGINYEMSYLENEVQQAGVPRGWITAVVFAFLLGCITTHYIENLFKANPETTTRVGRIEVKNYEKILEALIAKSEFDVKGYRKIEMYRNEEGDSYIISKVKEYVNKVQNREIEMQLTGRQCLKFDFEKGRREFHIDEYGDGTGKAYLRIERPTVIVLDAKAKILGENREWISLSKFNQTQEELRQELEQQAIEDGKKDPILYETGRKSLEEGLLEVFKAFKPYNLDIKEVVVEFIDPNEPTPIDTLNMGSNN